MHIIKRQIYFLFTDKIMSVKSYILYSHVFMIFVSSLIIIIIIIIISKPANSLLKLAEALIFPRINVSTVNGGVNIHHAFMFLLLCIYNSKWWGSSRQTLNNSICCEHLKFEHS